MRDEYLMTGSVGLDDDAWQPEFYDEDLPSDWRPAYYSTLLRSVYLSAEEWQRADGEAWLEEVDDDFRFVLELRSPSDYELLCKQQGEFLDQVAGVVLLSGNEENVFNDEQIIEVKDRFHVCLDAGAVDVPANEIKKRCEKLDVNCIWYPALQNQPLTTGNFLVTIINDEKLPEQKKIVTKIEQWMKSEEYINVHHESRRAGLFNDNQDNAPVRAQETRVLAELMGV